MWLFLIMVRKSYVFIILLQNEFTIIRISFHSLLIHIFFCCNESLQYNLGISCNYEIRLYSSDFCHLWVRIRFVKPSAISLISSEVVHDYNKIYEFRVEVGKHLSFLSRLLKFNVNGKIC